MKKSILLLLLTIASSCSFAAQNVTSKITRIGCHLDQNLCFVYLEGSVTDTQCTSDPKSIRWNTNGEFNTDSVMSILLTAQASGKSVTFGRPNDSCYYNFPSFTWVTLLEN